MSSVTGTHAPTLPTGSRTATTTPKPRRRSVVSEPGVPAPLRPPVDALRQQRSWPHLPRFRPGGRNADARTCSGGNTVTNRGLSTASCVPAPASPQQGAAQPRIVSRTSRGSLAAPEARNAAPCLPGVVPSGSSVLQSWRPTRQRTSFTAILPRSGFLVLGRILPGCRPAKTRRHHVNGPRSVARRHSCRGASAIHHRGSHPAWDPVDVTGPLYRRQRE